MNDVLIGNLTSLFAMVTDSISGTRHKQKSILFYQSISQVFYGVSSVILKGYSSAVQNAVGILRNVTAIYRINSKVLEWTLVLLGVVLGYLADLIFSKLLRPGKNIHSFCERENCISTASKRLKPSLSANMTVTF